MMQSVHPLLLQQLLRAWGVDTVDELQVRLTGAADSDGLARLLAMVSERYSQFDGEPGRQPGGAAAQSPLEPPLTDGERQFRSLVANIPGCVYRRLNDAVPTMLFVSEAIIDATGWPPSEFVQGGRSLASQIHPQDRPMVMRAIDAAVQAHQSFDIHYRYRHRDGSPRWANERGQGVYDDAGRLLYLDGVLFDRTASELARQQLSETRQQFLDTVEALDIGVLMMDRDERVIVCNRKYRSWHPGYEHMLVPGTHGIDVMRAIYRSGLDDPTQNQGEQAWVDKRRAQRLSLRDGPQVREVHIDGHWFRIDDSRTADGVTISLRTDITPMKQAMHQLERARDHAEAASRAKTRFLANMSHELRTPLNAVIGAAQLMKNGEQTPEQREYLADAIGRSGVNLLGLIENILNLSRIEAGQLTLVTQDFHLIECVDAAITTVALAAREKGVALACIVDPDLACWRHGDGDRLRQVLLNLLGNAVKFTQRGEIVIHVGPGAQPDELHLRVADTGVGIDAASLVHVFEPFRQGDEGSDRRFGGSGLGLAIVHQLVQAMGGQISVHSTPGAGSRFDLALRLPTVPDPAVPAPALGLRVAYVEAHEASAEALHKLLLRMGCEPRRCDDLRDLRQWCGQEPDVLARSWLLTCTDIAGSAALLTQAAQLIDPRHVIGMSSVASWDDALTRDALRWPRSVIKPVSRTALASRFASDVAVADVHAGRSEPAGSMAPWRTSIHVLVVEDDPLNQTIVCELLRHAGLRASAVANGLSAIDALGKAQYSVVLMDWQMPDLDGLEVTRRLRAGASGDHGRQVPIIALTANAFAEDRDACLAAGMNDFLSKPVLAASLVATVRRWSQTSTAATVPEPALGPRQQAERLPVFDPAVLASLPMVADGSQPDYPAEVLHMFVESVPAILEAASRAVDLGDATSLRRAVHTLKSTSATVGAMALAKRAEQAENQLRQGAAASIDPLRQLRAEFDNFTLALAGQHVPALPAEPTGIAS